MLTRIALAAIALAALVAACGDDGSPVASGAADLDGRQFVLTAASGFERVAGTTVSIRFDDGNVGADAGCNSIGGPYRLDGSTLVVEGLAMTEIGCDPDRHAQDDALAELLTEQPTVTLDGDRLVIETSATRLELLDREVADPDRPLVGPTWTLDTIITGEAASTVPGESTFTIRFDRDSSAIVVAGCNDAAVPYDSGPGDFPSAGEIQLGPATSSTDRTCPEAERHLLEVLSGEITYEIDVDRLTITNGDLGAGFAAG